MAASSFGTLFQWRGWGLFSLLLAFVGSVTCGPTCQATCNGTNEYWSGFVGNGTQLVLASVASSSPPPIPGDLLMIIQMQGGTINYSDDINYGENKGTGNGFTNVGLAGQYEFAEVASAVSSNITLSRPLDFQYSSKDNNRFQVIRVALCKEAIVDNPDVPAWNGSTGGVLVVLAEHIRLGNVSLEGKGFRGGPEVNTSGGIIVDLLFEPARFRDNSTYKRLKGGSPYNAPKGEGFIGSPRFLGGLPTYPKGFDCAKGAPGNAGGGSNWRDTGAGGGANAGKGGDGALFTERLDSGASGFGGAPAPSNVKNRIFLGENARLIQRE